MAKIGEGDPRWIVTQRDDGKNVNAWHWEERDLSNSTHEALKDLLRDKVILENEDISLKVDEISEISGDVTIAQRKGKIMCYFELKCTMKWSGNVKNREKEDETVKVEGKMTVPELDHDNYDSDFSINVSVMDRNPSSARAENIVQKEGRKMFRELIKEYFKILFKQHNVGSKITESSDPGGSSSGTTLSSSSSSNIKGDSAGSPVSLKSPSQAKTPTNTSTPSSKGIVTSFALNSTWRVPIEELFNILLDERRATGYTRCIAKIDPRSAGVFEFLGGTISGFFGEIIPNEKITMQWRLSSWPTGHFSSVVMEFKKEESSVTKLSFAQAGIPENEVERVKQGWLVNFFEPIKLMFGYSFNLDD